MEISNFKKINKDRLFTFLKHLENKNLDTDEMFGKCLVSQNLKTHPIVSLVFNKTRSEVSFNQINIYIIY